MQSELLRKHILATGQKGRWVAKGCNIFCRIGRLWSIYNTFDTPKQAQVEVLQLYAEDEAKSRK